MATTGESARGGRPRAPGGWRYLWEQVSQGAEDYYSADVARGEAPGRWCGSAAHAELGLVGVVTEEQMERVFGLSCTRPQGIGPGAKAQYRNVVERLGGSRARPQVGVDGGWAAREIGLVDSGASVEQIDAELAGRR